MFADYEKMVLEDYRSKKSRNMLSSGLIRTTQAKLKKECVRLCKDDIHGKDEKVIRDFCEEWDTEKSCLQNIGKYDVDKFKALSNFMKGNSESTDPKNIQLLAWLIDFPHRPFDYNKDYSSSMVEAPKSNEDRLIQEDDSLEEDDTIDTPLPQTAKKKSKYLKVVAIGTLLAALLVCILSLYPKNSAQQIIPKPSWLKDTVIAGIPIQKLRAPKAEITSSRVMDILSIQRDLDRDLQRAKAWQVVSFNGTTSEIEFMKKQDPSWPVEYYQKELDAYAAYNNTIQEHDKLEVQTKGYCFISKPFVTIREGATNGGRTMGKLYLGTYIKIEDTDETGTAYVTVPGLPGVEGIIHTGDYVDSLYKLKATDQEMNTFKNRIFANFEIDPGYAIALKKEQQAQDRRGQSYSRGLSRSPKNRTYITGPRGGCYYINSNGNKVYVDHSFCQ
ncbi:MAG: hypothetical protein JST68_17380 [Bacteroidetes bacterium]|nr:hypothetical protein [Bacteroidota bacterium]